MNNSIKKSHKGSNRPAKKSEEVSKKMLSCHICQTKIECKYGCDETSNKFACGMSDFFPRYIATFKSHICSQVCYDTLKQIEKEKRNVKFPK